MKQLQKTTLLSIGKWRSGSRTFRLKIKSVIEINDEMSDEQFGSIPVPKSKCAPGAVNSTRTSLGAVLFGL